MKLIYIEFIKIVCLIEIRYIWELFLVIMSIKISLNFLVVRRICLFYYEIYIMCGEYVLFFFKENNWVYIVDIFFDIEKFLLGLW